MGLAALASARLGTQVPELAGRTAGAADLSRLMAQGSYPQVTPFAHVIPGGIDAQASEGITGVHGQLLRRQVVVMLTVRSHDATGARALERIEELIDAVVLALAGWTPEPGGWAFDLVSCRTAAAVAGTFVYELTFALTDLLRIPA